MLSSLEDINGTCAGCSACSIHLNNKQLFIMCVSFLVAKFSDLLCTLIKGRDLTSSSGSPPLRAWSSISFTSSACLFSMSLSQEGNQNQNSKIIWCQYQVSVIWSHTVVNNFPCSDFKCPAREVLRQSICLLLSSGAREKSQRKNWKNLPRGKTEF